MTTYRIRRPSPTLLLALALFGAAGPTAAQESLVPGVGDVGQAVSWTGVLEPATLFAFDSVLFEARGLVGIENERVIGWLALVGNGQGYVATARFPPLGGTTVRIALLDGPTPLTEVRVLHPLAVDRVPGAIQDPSAAGSSGGREAAPAIASGDVTIAPGVPGPPLPRAVTVSLFQQSGFASASGEVVGAPAFELDLGSRTEVIVGGRSFQATTVRFLADSSFPPPGSPSAYLERVDVSATSFLGTSPGPSVDFVAELVEPGVLFSGIPVTSEEGRFTLELDHERGAIGALNLGSDDSPVSLVTGDAAGVAAVWGAVDLAGATGGSIELAAIGQNIASVEVRGVVTARRTAGSWELLFRPPGGAAGVPRTIEVDGVAVGAVTVPAPEGVFARSPTAPSGAVAFPIGLGEGAFYGFSWDEPTAIEVPGAGTFTGRTVRLVFPQSIGPLAFGGLSIDGISRLLLTGLAAPNTDRGGLCIASATRMCLAAGGRFAVDVAWSDPLGGGGAGVARPLTEDTGAFWFFEPANLELLVKVLDACPVNGHFWVFAGGLTNVEVELTVTDTRTGLERRYPSPQGQAFQPIQDTAAFATCAP